MPGPLIDLSLTPVSVRGPAATSWPGITELRPLWSAAEHAGRQRRRRPARRPAIARAGGSRSRSRRCPVFACSTSARSSPARTSGRCSPTSARTSSRSSGRRSAMSSGWRTAAAAVPASRCTTATSAARCSICPAGDDRLLFDRLVGSADVVVDNYRAGVASRLGITHDQLAAVNPAVVTVSISAFGDTGPLGRRPGFDPVIQAMSGIMRAQGGPDQADSPAFLTVPINDVLAAGLAALGACAALLARSPPRPGTARRGHAVRRLLPAPVRVPDPVRVPAEPGPRPRPAGAAPTRQAAGTSPGPGPLDRLYQAADGWVRLAAVARPAPRADGRRAGPGTRPGQSPATRPWPPESRRCSRTCRRPR